MYALYAVTIAVKSRNVTVTGPLGTLKRNFRHLALDINVDADAKSLKVDMWFGTRESVAAIRYVN
jgi:large subunit ribosomal protein L9e